MNDQGGQRAGSKPSLLLHVCCAPCSTHVIETLQEMFEVTAFFYNPNIYPPHEHRRRAQEARRLCRRLGVEILTEEYDAHNWSRRMKGRQSDREGGRHCAICFRIRLARTAVVAEGRGFDRFATTLTVSPHKDAWTINQVGQKVARGLQVKFYPADFKKRNGFKRSCQLSRKYGLYRQDYCGCVYSLRERDQGRTAPRSSPKVEKGRKR